MLLLFKSTTKETEHNYFKTVLLVGAQSPHEKKTRDEHHKTKTCEQLSSQVKICTRAEDYSRPAGEKIVSSFFHNAALDLSKVKIYTTC